MTPGAPSTRPPAPGRPRPSRRALLVIGGLAVVAAAAGIWLVVAALPHWLATPGSTARTTTGPGAAAAADARRIKATLFYVDGSGDALQPVDREVPYAASPVEQARQIVEAQVAPPPQGLVSPIPAGTSLRSLYLTPNGDAFVDLSHEVVTNHTGGSLDEALTVFAIVDALTTNLHDVSHVQILVDGQQVDTLVGHIDLRRPLAQSMQWVRKDQKQ